METTIYPHVLKDLMERQNLTQQTLADKSGVGIATIKRICAPKDKPKIQRQNTLDKLAKALRVTKSQLIGSKSPEREDDGHLQALVNVKAPISRQNNLSYQAVEEIYGISQSAQIAMAPLFSALIAEASLKWRKDRLAALGLIADQLDDIREDTPLLTQAFTRAWEAEKIEKQSIEERDIFGHHAAKDLNEMYELASSDIDVIADHKLPNECISPFVLFLKDFAASFAQSDITIDLGDESGDPQIPNGTVDYRVGEKLFAEICGPNRWAKIAVEFGYAAINQIPGELRSTAKFNDRVDFLKSCIPDEQRLAHAREEIERLNQMFSTGDDPKDITDDNIQQMLDILDEEYSG
jgi:transcriptional regulator with XRE-family HTH domain